MHGGAPGSGAPPCNRNRLKHGRYTAEMIAARRLVAGLLREGERVLREFEEEG